ncbi:hypothetical protein [Vreelandella aquamarina]|uniref:Pepco domain-containing protein n=1 Tax=Vreelandella aquamarina TaxID=77097 RepID=UPI0038504E60
MKPLIEQPQGICFHKPLFLKTFLLLVVLPGMSLASEQEQTQVESTLPFLIMSEDPSPTMNYGRPYVIIAEEYDIAQFPPQVGEGPWLPEARLTPSVEDIPMQAFADFKAKIEEAFDLMGDAPDSNYQLESIELHVTASAEGKLLIATAGMEGGMKLVFKRR